tara:strand:+ start:11626 stop:11808 length:183 start_codon:yes stop_codon:yes gene_type:complete
MDVVVPLVLVIVTFIFEPGNKKINTYCEYAVEETEEFTSRKECWDYYKDYRDDIPDIYLG